MYIDEILLIDLSDDLSSKNATICVVGRLNLSLLAEHVNPKDGLEFKFDEIKCTLYVFPKIKEIPQNWKKLAFCKYDFSNVCQRLSELISESQKAENVENSEMKFPQKVEVEKSKNSDKMIWKLQFEKVELKGSK